MLPCTAHLCCLRTYSYIHPINQFWLNVLDSQRIMPLYHRLLHEIRDLLHCAIQVVDPYTGYSTECDLFNLKKGFFPSNLSFIFVISTHHFVLKVATFLSKQICDELNFVQTFTFYKTWSHHFLCYYLNGFLVSLLDCFTETRTRIEISYGSMKKMTLKSLSIMKKIGRIGCEL